MDGNGKYQFELSGLEYVLGKHYRHSAMVYDDDGDVTEAYLFPDYLVKVTTYFDKTIKLRRFEPGRVVKISIMDAGGAVLYPPDEFTLNEFTIPENGRFNIGDSDLGVEYSPRI